MLSDEDRKTIWESMPVGKMFDSDDLMNAAFALGAERARVVKPLVWTEHADHSWGICKEPLCTYYTHLMKRQ